MNHPEALAALKARKVTESYASAMLSAAFNNGYVNKLGIVIEYSGPFGYTFSS